MNKLNGSLLAIGAFALVAAASFVFAAPTAHAAPSVVISDQPAVGVVGKVVGSKLTGVIKITYPADQQHFTDANLVVSGVCPAGSLVSIYDNNALRASGRCNDGGTFAIPIELFVGKNTLQAKAVTELNQGDLWSNIVTVYLDVPANCGTGIFRLLPVEGVVDSTPSAMLMRHMIIIGGTEPYTLTWAWGDGKTDTSVAKAEGQTELSHVYDATGIYTVKVKAVDNNGAVATTQVVSVIVNPAVVDLPGSLLSYWPLALLILLLLSAYLWGHNCGRKYEHELELAHIRAALDLHAEQEASAVQVSAVAGPAYVGAIPGERRTSVPPAVMPVAGSQPAPAAATSAAAPAPEPAPAAVPAPEPALAPMPEIKPGDTVQPSAAEPPTGGNQPSADNQPTGGNQPTNDNK
jgi:PKD repeat protein